MRSNLLRGGLYAAATTFLLSCADVATGPLAVSGSSLKAGAPAPSDVMISQVYGGGGNAGPPAATFQNDFIELFNAGGTSQSLSGWSVQYASATGNFQSSNSQTFALSGSIEPGQYILIRMSGGSTGAALPAADLAGSTNLSGTTGKVALVRQAAALGCGATATPCDAAQKGLIIDLVGYGTVSMSEGTSVQALANNRSARRNDSCIDSDNNASDFTSVVPTPRNSATTRTPCTPPPAGFANVVVNGGAVDSGSTVVLTAELRDSNGEAIDDPLATVSWTSNAPAIASIVSTAGRTATIKGEKPGSTTITVSATSGGTTRSADPEPTVAVIGGLDRVEVTGTTTVAQDATTTLTATLKDAAGQAITDAAATFSWTSTDPATAEITSTAANTAVIKGLLPGGPIAIDVSATSKGVTKSASPSPAITVTGPPVIVPSSTIVSEIHYDANVTNDAGEAIELEGNAGSSLNGWTLLLYNGNGGAVYQTIPLSGTFPATCDTRGVIVHNFPSQSGGYVQNGAPDGWALVNPSGQITEFKSYEGTFAATNGAAVGLTSTSIGVLETNSTSATSSLQRAKSGAWFGPSSNTFGACNPAEAKPAETITLSGRRDIPLGMQMDFRYDGTDGSGNELEAVTWSSANTAIATVDQEGIVSGVSVGSAEIIVTAPDGSTGKTTVTVYVPAGATNLRLGHNEEFGEPRDGAPADDIIIRRDQYTVSYNPNRGGANWVSWNISASHITQAVTRCDGGCYSADTALVKLNLPAYTTTDWVSNLPGITGYDRGHMAPSADWTSSEADNVTTFFLTNFLPQRADLNQGPWEDLESALRDSVKAGREVYVIAGGVFTNGVGLGTLLNKGKIGIPDSTWKIAVITPAGAGIGAAGTLPAGTTVVAVNMPNITGIRDVDWRTYLTTVARIEQSTGYDFLDLLTEPTECLVEGRNCAPTARITGTFTANEGQSLTFSAATSSDPNSGDVLAKQWYLNGMPAGNGETFSHAFDDDGLFEVRLVVTDAGNMNSTAVATVSIANVAPVVGIFNGATILRGETYSASGSFTDPGADAWSGNVSYGDGASAALAITGKSFSVSHHYATAGTFTVTVSVSDGAASGSRTATVMVKSATQGIADLDAAVLALGLNKGQANSLQVKLANATSQIAGGMNIPAANMLEAFINEVNALSRSGRISAASAAQLTAYAQRVIASM